MYVCSMQQIFNEASISHPHCFHNKVGLELQCTDTTNISILGLHCCSVGQKSQADKLSH